MEFEPLFSAPRAWRVAGLALLMGGVILSVWVPSERREDTVCFLRQATGVNCPGCGLTRGLAHLAKGEVRGSFSSHPFAPLLGLEILAGWVYWGLVAHRRAVSPRIAWVNRFLATHAFALTAIWAIRLL